MKPLHRFTVLPTVPKPLEPLSVLARNLRWTWHPPVQDLFAAMDPAGWEASGNNPLRMLNEADAAVLERAAADPAFLAAQAAAADDLARYLHEPRWYQSLSGAPSRIAYFSPEFGVSEVLPQYSGGLGVLAGDHLKAASDLGVPLVGVSLFYRSGYFRQALTADGRQLEAYPAFNPQELPLELVTEGGRPLRISVRLPGGVRPLEALGLRAEVFHTNEGHAGFLGLERIRRLVQDDGLDPASAIEAVRAGTIFTTHTPVEAGIDRFPRPFIERYFGPSGVETGLEVNRIMELGAEPEGDGSMFNMAVMGLRLAQRANGVSRLHGQVSRELFHGLWAGFSAAEVPIRHVTNGVHGGTWIEREWLELFERYLGPDFRTADRPWTPLTNADDGELWELRERARRRLVADVRRRMAVAWRARGASEGQLGWITRAFDPEVLTIGFARRVPSYKRLTLLLKDRERLTRLLLDPERPIQLVIAGKAHPADEGGKEMIAEFARFAADPRVRHRIAFLPDYDMAMARTLVAGADVWLNNPLRPYEACGTSGMKAALNGSLNLSIRDGWWDECYDGRNGWAIPSADDPSIPPERRDELEASAIFDLLEHEIVPLFYDRSDHLPSGWIAKVKHSLVTLGPPLLASRMVREYTEDYYLPAAERSWRLQAGGFAAARELAAWKERVTAAWPGVVVRRVSSGQAEPALGSRLKVRAVVELGNLEPDEVEAQIAYGRVDDADELQEVDVLPLKQEGQRSEEGWLFEGEVPLVTPGAFGYTVRVVPRHPSLIHPAELGLVAWASG